MSYFDFEWDTNNVNRTQFNTNRGRVEYLGIDKTMTIVSKNIFEGANVYEFDVTYYVSRDGYFTFGACKVDYSNWMNYCHKDQGIGMIGTYMGGGVRQVITLRGKLDMSTKTLYLSRRHTNRTDTVEYNFTHLMSYNGIRLGVSFSDRGDFLELSNWRVTTPQIYGNYGNTPNPIYFAWELNNRNNSNFRIENGTTLRYTSNDQTMTAVSQCVFYDHINEFDVTYWCNKGTHFTLGVVANSFSEFNGYCHTGQGIGMIGTYLGGGDRQVIDLHIKIDMPRKELTIIRKNNGQSGVYNFALIGSNGVRFAAACTYRDDFVTIQTPVIYPSSGFNTNNNNYNYPNNNNYSNTNNYPINNYPNFPPLNYFEWETNPTNQSFFRIDRKRVDYLGVDKTMTITSRTIFYSDCEFDVSYYCTRDGYFTFGVVKPTYTNYLQYCHKDQGIGMIGTYFGGGTRQRIDLRVRIDINRRELTITRKNNGQCGVYNFGHLYSNGIKLAASFSDNMDFIEVI